MRTYIDKVWNLTAGRGLYCIWVPAKEGEPMPLVARWIDPQAEAPERHEEEDLCAKEEPGERWLATEQGLAA